MGFSLIKHPAIGVHPQITAVHSSEFPVHRRNVADRLKMPREEIVQPLGLNPTQIEISKNVVNLCSLPYVILFNFYILDI